MSTAEQLLEVLTRLRREAPPAAVAAVALRVLEVVRPLLASSETRHGA